MFTKTWSQAQIIDALTATILREGFVVDGDIDFEAVGGMVPGDPFKVNASAKISKRKPVPRAAKTTTAGG